VNTDNWSIFLKKVKMLNTCGWQWITKLDWIACFFLP
jgi:hypothetical protein